MLSTNVSEHLEPPSVTFQGIHVRRNSAIIIGSGNWRITDGVLCTKSALQTVVVDLRNDQTKVIYLLLTYLLSQSIDYILAYSL